MDLNSIFKNKTLPLGVIIIIITYLVSGSSSNILPYVFFTAILVGIMRKGELAESAIVGMITTFIACLITTLISTALYYVLYGPTYMTYTLSSSMYFFAFYVILGAVGGALGHYAAKELKLM